MIRVMHRYPEWLPLTMTWLNQLIRDTDPYVRNRILAEVRLPTGPDHPGLFISRQASPVAYWLTRGLRKAGVIRHLEPDLSHLKRTRPDVFHSHFGHIGANDAPLVSRLGIPHVVSFYGMDVHQLPYSDAMWTPRYRNLFDSGARILCEGSFMRSSIIRLGAQPDSVVVHRLGVDITRFPFRPRRVEQGQSLKILMASSFRPKKGIPTGIEAVAKASAEIPVELTIVGGPSAEDTSEARLIDQAAAHAHIGSRIRFLGFLEPARLREVADGHHVFLAPSLTAADGDCEGGIPVSLLEMAASGMIIVSTRHCDIPAVVEHGRTGWLASERQSDVLASHLVDVWNRREQWGPVQIALRQLIESQYNHAVQATELVRLYETMVAES
jgi:colanic acid/amylovoran biosynthesis glycosyltransferase